MPGTARRTPALSGTDNVAQCEDTGEGKWLEDDFSTINLKIVLKFSRYFSISSNQKLRKNIYLLN